MLFLLTALEVVYKDRNRYYKLDRENISKAVRNLTLDNAWTPEFACYLMLTSGLLSESIWFNLQLGDWKNAVILATLYQKRCQFFKACSFIPSLELPTELTTQHIIQSHINRVLHINKKIIEGTTFTTSLYQLIDLISFIILLIIYSLSHNLMILFIIIICFNIT